MNETTIRARVSIGSLLIGLERLVFLGHAKTTDLCESDVVRLEKAATKIRELIGTQPHTPALKSDALYDPTCSKCGDPLTTNELVCSDCKRTA